MKLYPENNELVLSGNELLGLIKDVQKKGGSLRFRAGGYSMKPSIRNNDLIKISPLPERGIFKGDIVLFRKSENSQIVVHRIVKKRADSYLVKGDNSLEDDGWITGDKIHGIVSEIKRNGRSIQLPGLSGNTLPNRVFLFFFMLFIKVRKKIAGVLRKLRTRGNKWE